MASSKLLCQNEILLTILISNFYLSLFVTMIMYKIIKELVSPKLMLVFNVFCGLFGYSILVALPSNYVCLNLAMYAFGASAALNPCLTLDFVMEYFGSSQQVTVAIVIQITEMMIAIFSPLILMGLTNDIKVIVYYGMILSSISVFMILFVYESPSYLIK